MAVLWVVTLLTERGVVLLVVTFLPDSCTLLHDGCTLLPNGCTLLQST